MRKLPYLWICLFVMAISSCKNDDEPLAEEPTPTFEESESEWIRLVLWDSQSKIRKINPTAGSIDTPDVSPFVAGSANYLSTSGRFIISIDRPNGKVRFLDTGLENHGDHGHENPAKWLSGVLEAPLPTHFSASMGNIVIFNDGDGSVALLRESVMETPSFQPRLIYPEGTKAHHGAGVWLMGNKLAISYQDPDIAGALPQRVKILDLDGKIIAEDPSVSVTGIHGDASNGKVGIFGAMEGILAVTSSNIFKLVPNIAPLAPTSGNWMGTVKGHDKLDVFYGWARNQGVFKINTTNSSMQQVYGGSDVRAYFISEDGTYLIIQKTNQDILVFKADTGVQLVSKNIQAAIDDNAAARVRMTDFEAYRKMAEENPILSASENYLYVLEPGRDKITVRDIITLDKVAEMTVPADTKNIMRVGFQTK